MKTNKNGTSRKFTDSQRQAIMDMAYEFYNLPVSEQQAYTKKWLNVDADLFKSWMKSSNIEAHIQRRIEQEAM